MRRALEHPLAPVLGAVLFGLIYLAAAPATADMAGHSFRNWLFERDGAAVWNAQWYGGHHVLGYSLLFAPPAALLGPAAVGVLAAVAATAAFGPLARTAAAAGGHGPQASRAAAATWLFAAGMAANVAIGRMPFALGLAFALAAWLCAERARGTPGRVDATGSSARRHPRAWSASAALLALAAVWASPVAGAFLLLAAAGFAHAGRLGLVGLAVVAVLWALDGPLAVKSNVRVVATSISPSLRPGDLVVATQPEQVPVLDYYLPDGLRYATLTGPVADNGVTDWRDGVERLRETSAERDLAPLLDSLEPGQRLALVVPQIYAIGRWSAPWTELVRLRSEEWLQFVSNDSRLGLVAVEPANPFPSGPNPVRAQVYLKR